MANRGEWQLSETYGECAGCGTWFDPHTRIAVDRWASKAYCEACGSAEERKDWWDEDPGLHE